METKKQAESVPLEGCALGGRLVDLLYWKDRVCMSGSL